MHRFVSGFPPKLFDLLPLQHFAEKRFPSTMYIHHQSVVYGKKALILAAKRDLPQHVCWHPLSVLKYSHRMEKWFFFLSSVWKTGDGGHNTTWEEKSCSWTGGGTRAVSQASYCSLPFLHFLGTPLFHCTISWEERSRSCRDNECFGYPVTQKQWEKCKQSLGRSLDPSSLTWSPWLLWRDKLWYIVCFSLDTFITLLI